MAQPPRNITDLVNKIGKKVPWDNLNINDDDIELLNNTNGEELAKISYSNQISFGDFISNADEVIQATMEKKFQKYYNDVKNLKAELEAPIGVKEKVVNIEPIKPIDPSIREREIIEEAIAEMLEGKSFLDESSATHEENSQIQIENFLNRLQQPKNDPPRQLFVDTLQMPKMIDLISLQRKQADSQMTDLASANQITLPDNTLNVNPLLPDFVDELPEASLEDVAKLGFLDGAQGRKIFDIIRDKEERGAVRRTDEEENMAVNNTPQMRMTSFNGRENLIEDINDSIPPQQQQQEQAQNIQSASDASIPSLEHSSIAESRYNQRLQMIANAYADEEPEKKPKPKRKIRVPRNKRILSATQSVTAMAKPLPKMKKPITRRKTPNTVELTFNNHHRDFFAETDIDYELDDYPLFVPQTNDIEMEMAMQQQQQIEPQQDIPINETATNKHAIESPPPVQNANKKIKNVHQNAVEVSSLAPEPPILDLTSLHIVEASAADLLVPPQNENSAITAPQIAIHEVPEIPEVNPSMAQTNVQQDISNSDIIIRNSVEMAAANTASPARAMLNQTPRLKVPSFFQKSIVKTFESIRQTSQRNESKMVTRKDLEYARLKELSKQEMLFEPPQIPSIPNEGTSASSIPVLYREVRENGIDYIKFKNQSNQIVKYEEYNIENMMLYMQIRKYMKANKTWKVPVSEILEKGNLKLFEPGDKRLIVRRMWLLCDYKLLNGTWAEDDDTKLMEIEIPIRQVQHGEDKENNPA